MVRLVIDLVIVAAAIVGILTYMDIKPNALHEIPDKFQEEVNIAVRNSDLEFDESEYLQKKKKSFLIYLAADKMLQTHNRDTNFEKSSKFALLERDFKLAIRAAKKIRLRFTRDNTLSEVVVAALEREEDIGYAIIAAENIAITVRREKMLGLIVEKLEKREG